MRHSSSRRVVRTLLVVAASVAFASLASAQQSNFPELLRSSSPSDLMTPFATTRATSTTSEVVSPSHLMGLLTAVQIPIIVHDSTASQTWHALRIDTFEVGPSAVGRYGYGLAVVGTW